MLKNDLLKNNGEIIRIITIKNNYALVINCIKRNMPYWINIELLESYIPCNDQELLIISHKTLYNIDELDARSQSIIYFRYGIIEPLIYEIDNKKKRNILIKNISIQNNISGQTLRKYLCDYLAFQDKTILAPKKNISNKTLSKDEKNIRWALNKFFYTKRKNSLYTAYLFMLKEKYTINDKLQESHPSFYQFRYFYRKTKKLQTYYISRNGIKDYQKNHRPLLGNGIKEFAPTIGTGMLDSTICDIYLINTDGNIIGRPRANGVFRRNGLIVNNLRYKNDTYKEYYLSGKIVNVAYDPNNIDSIWLIENGDYVKFNLIELEYSGKTLNEIEELRKKKKQILKAYQENEYQSRINLISEIDNVKNLVKQRNSVPVNTKYIRDTRTLEIKKELSNDTRRDR